MSRRYLEYKLCLHTLLGTVVLVLLASNATAQSWELGNSIPGVAPMSGATAVRDLVTWDPDGSGPLESVLVVAGTFEIQDVPGATNIATWDGESWAPLGMGLGVYTGSFIGSEAVNAVAVLPTGELIAGGSFEMSGSAPMPYLALWTGTQWQQLGMGVNDTVTALAVSTSGELAVGGGFSTAGGINAEHVAIWDGLSWSPLGNGTGNRVTTLAYLDNGDLAVGGAFTTAGIVMSNGVAIWDGLSWHGLDGGVNRAHGAGDVASLAADGNAVIVGGNFNSAGGQTGSAVSVGNVARWTGTAWQPLGSLANGLGGVVWSLEMLSTTPPTILAVGEFPAGATGEGIAVWNGFAWDSLGDADIICGGFSAGLCSLELSNGDIVVGGRSACLDGAESLLPNGLARWDGTRWLPYGRGAEGPVHAITTTPGNRQLVGGTFEGIGGYRAHRAGLLDNGEWSRFDDFASADVLSTAEFAGDYYIGVNGHAGCFRWGGTSWVTLMLGGGFVVNALETLSNDQGLVAGGVFTQAGGENIALWNGTAWSPLGGGPNDAVHSLLDVAGVGLYCGGAFTMAGGVPANGLALWDGLSWTQVGGGVGGPVYALSLNDNGDLIVGGQFTGVGSGGGAVTAMNVARWDGSAWNPVGSGFDNSVYALDLHPDGTLYAGGIFPNAGSTQVRNLAAFDGQSWQSVGGGTDGAVRALSVDVVGTLHIGGDFTTVGAGIPSSFYARWFPGAPPTSFERGDCNNNGAVNLADAVLLLNWLFVPMSTEPTCHDACDANDDGALNLSDAIYFLTYLFVQGPPPPAPAGSCGVDLTTDTSTCVSSSACP